MQKTYLPSRVWFLLILSLLSLPNFLHGQTYLDSLYGISVPFFQEVARGAYEMEDASIVFIYTSIDGFENQRHIRIGRIEGNGELVFDKGVNDTASSKSVFDFMRTLDGNFVACGRYIDLTTDTISYYLVKFSPLGDEIWSRIYRTSDFIAECLAVYPLADGGFLLAGQQIVYNPNPIPGHALVIRVDSTGEELWRQTYGVDNWQEVIKSIAPTPDGGFLMAGYGINPYGSHVEYQGFLLKTDSLGNEQWMQRYGEANGSEVFLAIQPTSDGNFLVTGDINYSPVTIANIGADWVLKVTVEGEILWDRKYMDRQGYNWLEDFVQLPDGSIVAAGATTGTPNGSQAGFLIKITAEGDSLWSHIYDRHPGYIDLFYSISATMDGGFVMSGFSRQPDGSSQDVWILKVDSLGCAMPGCFATDVAEEPVAPLGKLEVWPNPFRSLLKVRLPAAVSNTPERLRLLALSGQVLWEKDLPPGATEIEADLAVLPAGLYFLLYERQGLPPMAAKVLKGV